MVRTVRFGRFGTKTVQIEPSNGDCLQKILLWRIKSEDAKVPKPIQEMLNYAYLRMWYSIASSLTPDHWFQLVITLVSVTPATIVSFWALRNQLAQTKTRLQVRFSPNQMKNIFGKPVLWDTWPGILVTNHSAFSVRVINVGYRVGKKHYEFGNPLDRQFGKIDWPYEMPARSRTLFLPNDDSAEVRELIHELTPILKGAPVWESGVMYALEETGTKFESPRISKLSIQNLRKLGPPVVRKSED